jgi:hypothetical protein
MLVPIKTFTVNTKIPSRDDLAEAKQLCIDEGCMVDLRWCPNVFAGWYHLYINADDDIDSMYQHQVPKTYGV